jgi:tryptophan-rich sensory protein
MNRTKQIRGLVFWIIVTFAAAAIGSVASMQAKSFYSMLARPSWAPPAWMFGPVWTFLYALMALDAWMLWRDNGGFRGAEKPIAAYIIQLAVNSLWTWLFFVWKQGAWSFAGIIILWGLLLVTMILFWRRKPLYGMLLLPYLAWVSFAAFLTWMVWQLNPLLLG